MNDTFFDGFEPFDRARLAEGGEVSNALDPSWAWAAGALVATPTDLLTWIGRLGDGTFFDSSTQSSLLASPVPTEDEGVFAGLGVFDWREGNRAFGARAIGHDGAISGFFSLAVHLRDKRVSAVAIVDGRLEQELVMAAALAALDGAASTP